MVPFAPGHPAEKRGEIKIAEKKGGMAATVEPPVTLIQKLVNAVFGDAVDAA